MSGILPGAVLANTPGAVLCVQHAADVPETQLSSKNILNVCIVNNIIFFIDLLRIPLRSAFSYT